MLVLLVNNKYTLIVGKYNETLYNGMPANTCVFDMPSSKLHTHDFRTLQSRRRRKEH